MSSGVGDDRRARWYALILVSACHGLALAMLLEPAANSAADGGQPHLLAVAWIAAATPARQTVAAAQARPMPAVRAPWRTQAALAPSSAESRPTAAAPVQSSSAAASAEAAGPAALPTPGQAPAELFTPPRVEAGYLSNPAPAYPSASRSRGEQGRVLLQVLVGARGEPEDVRLGAGSGFGRLDEAALAAVWRWKFVPAHRGDEAVAAWVQVPISFALQR